MFKIRWTSVPVFERNKSTVNIALQKWKRTFVPELNEATSWAFQFNQCNHRWFDGHWIHSRLRQVIEYTLLRSNTAVCYREAMLFFTCFSSTIYDSLLVSFSWSAMSEESSKSKYMVSIPSTHAAILTVVSCDMAAFLSSFTAKGTCRVMSFAPSTSSVVSAFSVGKKCGVLTN